MTARARRRPSLVVRRTDQPDTAVVALALEPGEMLLPTRRGCGSARGRPARRRSRVGRRAGAAPPRPRASRSSSRRTPRRGGRRAHGRARPRPARTSARSRRAACPRRTRPRRPQLPAARRGPDVEHLPCAEPDDRDVDSWLGRTAAAPSVAMPAARDRIAMVRSSPWQAAAPPRARSSPSSAIDARVRRRELPGRVAARARGGAPAPAGDLRLRAARRHPRRRG